MSLESTLRTVLGGNDQPRVWALNICLAEKRMQQVDCGIGYHWLLTFTKFPNPSWISSVVACSVALWFVLRIQVRVKPEKQPIKTSDQQTNLKICLCKTSCLFAILKNPAKSIKNQSCCCAKVTLDIYAVNARLRTKRSCCNWLCDGVLNDNGISEPQDSRLLFWKKLQIPD